MYINFFSILGLALFGSKKNTALYEKCKKLYKKKVLCETFVLPISRYFYKEIKKKYCVFGEKENASQDHSLG